MANKPTIQLAKVFKEALKAAGRTQIGFADSIQVDRSQFRVHLKRNTFSIEETEAIADFLEVGRERLAERFDFAVHATTREPSQPRQSCEGERSARHCAEYPVQVYRPPVRHS